MKLTARNEWILIGATILYLAFVPSPPIAREWLKNPVVKAAALVGVVYTWKNWSPILALLFLISYVRSGLIHTNVWEMFSGAEAACTCNGAGYNYDSATKKCKNSKGEEGTVAACSCAGGYAWDVTKKECTPVTDQQPPIPPVSPTLASPPTAAPAVPEEPVTAPSTAPITTPGAAMDMATGSTPLPPADAGVQPGAGTSSAPGNV